ncbi:MAG: DedA family protein [Anaerolineaceae bacterium]|nr:DedA family protein [Anaerolineaceae bacterium]
MGLGDILNAIKIWVENIISTMGYPGLYLVMFLENVFPPIPSEVVLPLAGSLTLTGRFTIPVITIVGMLGSLTGAFLFYGLGKWLGEPRVRALIAKFGKYALLSTDDLDRSLQWFDKYDDWVIFFSRMVPIVRSLISIPAGIASMNFAKFSFFTILGTALWSFVLSFTGRLLGEQWPLIADFINAYQNVVLVITIVAVISFVAYRLLKKTPKK